MEKYKVLLNKKINVNLMDMTMNSYKIVKMFPAHDAMPGRGRLYQCTIEWDKEMPGADARMDFDEQTMDELIANKKAMCPFMANLYYEMVD